jgi:hypothetical protein
MAADGGHPCAFDDLAAEHRWPRYWARMLAETELRSGICYPLSLAGTQLRALSLYSEAPGHFADPVTVAGSSFAAHCAVALQSAEVFESRPSWNGPWSATDGSGWRSVC